MAKMLSRQQPNLKNTYAVMVSVLAVLAIFVWIVMAAMPRT
jgi:hypothetical protein